MGKNKVIRQNWAEIKGAIRMKWDKLSDEELEQSQGDLDSLIQMLESKYQAGGDYRKTLNEIIEFFKLNQASIRAPNEDYYEHHPTAPRSAELSEFQDDSRDIKTRSPERRKFEELIEMNYQNPNSSES